MQTFNYHTHTYRCGHATGTDEEYVQYAIKAGYKTLGFSDHAPYEGLPLPRVRMNCEELDEYIASIKALKEKYKDQIDIKIGLETEFFPEYLDNRKEMLTKLDYLILGQHSLSPHFEMSYFSENTDEEILAYADLACQGMETGIFLYLAHPDVYMYKQARFNDVCKEAAKRILETAAKTDTPLEVNLQGVYRGKRLYGGGKYEYNYPHKDFWRMAAKYPVRCLLGTDAHSPDRLTDLKLIEDAHKELRDLPLNFIEKPLL